MEKGQDNYKNIHIQERELWVVIHLSSKLYGLIQSDHWRNSISISALLLVIGVWRSPQVILTPE